MRQRPATIIHNFSFAAQRVPTVYSEVCAEFAIRLPDFAGARLALPH
jgi:hypothetical protein